MTVGTPVDVVGSHQEAAVYRLATVDCIPIDNHQEAVVYRLATVGCILVDSHLEAAAFHPVTAADSQLGVVAGNHLRAAAVFADNHLGVVAEAAGRPVA